MLKVYFYKMNTEDLDRNKEKYLACLPSWRTERYQRMRIEHGKLEELAAGLLLRHALWDAAGIDLMNAEVTTNAHGKPMLMERVLPAPEISEAKADRSKEARDRHFFNLSHSGGYIVAAVADVPVGIDIETKTDPELKVTDRFYSKEEQEAVRAAEDPQKEFRRLWTRKEAYVKCLGTGITNSVADIPSLPDVSGDHRLITLVEEEAYTLSAAVRTDAAEMHEEFLKIPLDIIDSFDI